MLWRPRKNIGETFKIRKKQPHRNSTETRTRRLTDESKEIHVYLSVGFLEPSKKRENYRGCQSLYDTNPKLKNVPLFFRGPKSVIYTPQIDIAPEKGPFQKERILVQPTFFRGELLFFGISVFPEIQPCYMLKLRKNLVLKFQWTTNLSPQVWLGR